MADLTPKQLRILKVLSARGAWMTRAEMEEEAGRKGFSLSLGAPTAGEVRPASLERLGYVERRDMTPPFAYRLTLAGRQALEGYEREHGEVQLLTASPEAGQAAPSDYFFYNTDAGSVTEPPRPRFPVLIAGGFAAVGGDRRQYGEQFSQLAPGDVLLMYENGVGVLAVGRVRERWDGVSHSEPRYYRPGEMGGLTGGPYEYRIAVEWFLDLSDAPVSVEELRRRLGYNPRGAVQRVVGQRAEVARMVEEAGASLSLLPGEVARPNLYPEGAVRLVTVNAYERSQEAVRRCKEIHGTACAVCGFDFGAAYGPDFAGFIHVHHLRPLHEVGGSYVVDAGADLRPVCPNCHAVIHHGGQVRTPEAVRGLLASRRAALAPGDEGLGDV